MTDLSCLEVEAGEALCLVLPYATKTIFVRVDPPVPVEVVFEDAEHRELLRWLSGCWRTFAAVVPDGSSALRLSQRSSASARVSVSYGETPGS